jgi:peptidoglycan/xylan/chitin deacetylase (PgdA/CDA1 family)
MGSVRSFMFHDVRDNTDTNYPDRYDLKSFLNKKQFEHQISVINSSYTIIRSDDIPNVDFSDGVDYATLTFDDGLLDHHYVSKYLKSKNINGTFLIPTLPILEGKVIHTHKLQFIQSIVDSGELCEEILSNFDDKDQIWEKYIKTKWKNNWWSNEMIFITNILRLHKSDNFNNYDYTDFLFKKYVNIDEQAFSKDLYLTEDHLEEMSNDGMVIGGHGNTSENLLLIDDVDHDIKLSKKFIKKYSDKFIFSYPNGGYNDEIKEIMSNYGCILSYTVKPMTITKLDDIDYLEFPRYDAPQKIDLG